MIIYEGSVISAGDMTGNLTSSRIDCMDTDLGSIQCVWTGTSVGTLKIQGSNDDSTYSDLSGQTFSVTAAGSHMFELSAIGCKFLKVVYTVSVVNAGSLTCKAIMKERS